MTDPYVVGSVSFVLGATIGAGVIRYFSKRYGEKLQNDDEFRANYLSIAKKMGWKEADNLEKMTQSKDLKTGELS
jgi:hypothetical protein